MFKLSLKSALARKGRLLLTSLAVIAGCAFLSGVFVFSDTIRGTFDKLFANAYENTDAYVRSSNVIEADFGEESRDRVDDSLIPTITATPGVSEAVGDVQSFARVSTLDGTEIGTDGPPKYGGVFTDSAASPWDLAEGTVPTGPDQVVIDRSSAKQGDIAVGDQVDVTAVSGARRFTVVGIATFADSDTSGGATWALFDLPTAQEFVVGEPGKVDSIVVRSDGSITDEELKARLSQLFVDDEVEVLTGQEITDENTSDIQEGLGVFTIFLTVFAAISLFVGSFIIYNVFSISAAQRQKENALLRAIGASRRQVTRTLFVEALLIGALGGLLGFAGGVALAALINTALGSAGFLPTDTELVVSPSVLVITLIIGIVVTLVCAIVPALRAGRVPPLAAMRDVAVDRSGVSRSRLVIGLVFIAISAGGTALGLTGDAIWLGPGVVALFVALVVLGPLIAAPVSRMLTAPLSKLRGVTGEMAGRNASGSPKRTALTAAALGIGLALLVGVSTLGSSLKESIRSTIGDQFRGDFAVSPSGDGDGFGGLPHSITDELNELPQVAAAVGFGGGQLRLVEDGEPVGRQALTVEPEFAQAIFDLEFVAGGWEGLGPDTILMSEDKATRDGFTLGGPAEVVLLDGTEKTLTVSGIYDSDVFGNLIADRGLFDGQLLNLFDFQVLVQAAPGVDADEAQAALQAVTDKYPTSELRTKGEFIDAQAEEVDGFLNFIYALLAMSIFIAILGIVITLLLAVYERRRELGLVRAVGMTRPQVRGSVRWEAVITAILGCIMGTVLGLALGWIVVRALRDEGLNTFSVSTSSIVAFVVMSVIVAVIAAWIPARRAAKADILAAIATT
jgi:putative ABC transport system permease protein